MNTRIKIYGERNTNTNYLSRLLALNLDVEELPGVVPAPVLRAQAMLPGEEWLRDLYFSLTRGRNLGWKHACVDPWPQLRRLPGAREGTVFVTITKNPYSWLLSLYRRPYHRAGAPAPDFETFVRQPWRTVGRERAPRVVDSPVALWNLKNRSYLDLPEERTLRTTTEALFRDAAGVIDELATRFGMPRRTPEFVNHERSTKGEGRRTEDYRDYYLNERWKEKLGDEAIRLINERLDTELVSHYGYSLL